MELCDTIYVDAECWLQLADTYAHLGLHEQSLSALSDLLLLQPQNAYYVLRYAETAATLEDYELAYRYALRAIELCGARGIQRSSIGRRAALGLKMASPFSSFALNSQFFWLRPTNTRRHQQCIPKLQGKYLPGSKAPSEHSRSGAPSPQRLEDVDAIITEALLEEYEGPQDPNVWPPQVQTRSIQEFLKGFSNSTTDVVR